MEETELIKIGFTKNEAKIYLALIELGSTTTGPIVKKTGLHRVIVYDVLEQLIKKGLTSYVIKENRKYFEVADPSKLLSLLEEKKKEVEKEEELIKSFLPELEAKYKISKVKQEANLYKGKKGIKSILEDVLKTKKDYLIFGAEGKFREILPFYYPHYQKAKIKLKIKTRAIFNELTKNKKAIKEFIGQVRFISKEFLSPATTFIYDDKVAIIIWIVEPIGVLIKSKELAESYRSYFELMWKSAKK